MAAGDKTPPRPWVRRKLDNNRKNQEKLDWFATNRRVREYIRNAGHFRGSHFL